MSSAGSVSGTGSTTGNDQSTQTEQTEQTNQNQNADSGQAESFDEAKNEAKQNTDDGSSESQQTLTGAEDDGAVDDGVYQGYVEEDGAPEDIDEPDPLLLEDADTSDPEINDFLKKQLQARHADAQKRLAELEQQQKQQLNDKKQPDPKLQKQIDKTQETLDQIAEDKKKLEEQQQKKQFKRFQMNRLIRYTKCLSPEAKARALKTMRSQAQQASQQAKSKKAKTMLRRFANSHKMQRQLAMAEAKKGDTFTKNPELTPEQKLAQQLGLKNGKFQFDANKAMAKGTAKAPQKGPEKTVAEMKKEGDQMSKGKAIGTDTHDPKTGKKAERALATDAESENAETKNKADKKTADANRQQNAEAQRRPGDPLTKDQIEQHRAALMGLVERKEITKDGRVWTEEMVERAIQHMEDSAQLSASREEDGQPRFTPHRYVKKREEESGRSYCGEDDIAQYSADCLTGLETGAPSEIRIMIGTGEGAATERGEAKTVDDESLRNDSANLNTMVASNTGSFDSDMPIGEQEINEHSDKSDTAARHVIKDDGDSSNRA